MYIACAILGFWMPFFGRIFLFIQWDYTRNLTIKTCINFGWINFQNDQELKNDSVKLNLTLQLQDYCDE